jgi:hypothetical protein
MTHHHCLVELRGTQARQDRRYTYIHTFTHSHIHLYIHTFIHLYAGVVDLVGEIRAEAKARGGAFDPVAIDSAFFVLNKYVCINVLIRTNTYVLLIHTNTLICNTYVLIHTNTYILIHTNTYSYSLISRVVTMEEFFKNLKFYETILDCLLPLPTPSGTHTHIYARTHIHTYTHTHIHTHIHTYT